MLLYFGVPQAENGHYMFGLQQKLFLLAAFKSLAI